MRSILTKFLLAGLVLALAISEARAQGPPQGMPSPMGGPGGPGGASLILSPAVQDDLGLSDKQKAQVKKLQASMMQQMRDGMEQARQGGVDPQEMMEGMNTLRRENEAAMARVLDKAQRSRLAQIELQREGLLAVAKSEIAGKLKLTSPQNKKVKTIVDEMRQAQARAMPAPPAGGFPGGVPPVGPGGDPGAGGGFPDGGGFPGGFPGGGFPGGAVPGGGVAPGAGMPNFNSPEFRAQMAKAMEVQKKTRDAASAKIGEILTPDQTAALEKMTGKPFDFSKVTPGAPPADATPKAEEDASKKDAPAKTQPKMKSRKNQAP